MILKWNLWINEYHQKYYGGSLGQVETVDVAMWRQNLIYLFFFFIFSFSKVNFLFANDKTIIIFYSNQKEIYFWESGNEKKIY